MNKIIIYFLFVTISIVVYGCAQSRLSKSEEQVLKVIAYEKVSEATRNYFNSTYNPHESRLMRHDEIEKFLKKIQRSYPHLTNSMGLLSLVVLACLALKERLKLYVMQENKGSLILDCVLVCS